MKLTAGFNSADDYPLLAEAGADELFCGYVPLEWQLRYGANAPLNRREVLFCSVQLGGESELKILSSMVQELKVPVAIALNALVVSPQQYGFVENYVLRCAELGFRRFIAADPGLILHLSSRGVFDRVQLHISGEYGELNTAVMRQLDRLGAKRVIFHRHMSVQEMEICSAAAPGIREYEAFLLNEKCHFHGAYCASVHCDELPPLCRVPYVLSGGESMCCSDEVPEADCIGSSGCALCALPAMRAAGITHLKIVGRGNHSENILADVRAAKTALHILEESSSAQQYIDRMKKELFSEGCSGCCYYSV